MGKRISRAAMLPAFVASTALAVSSLPAFADTVATGNAAGVDTTVSQSTNPENGSVATETPVLTAPETVPASTAPDTGKSVTAGEAGTTVREGTAAPAAPTATPTSNASEEGVTAHPVAAAPAVLTPTQIQGTGKTTPFNGKNVTVRGVVTAVYPEGGFGGYFLQTAGTGKAVEATGASDAIWVHPGSRETLPQIGQCVQITGKAGEYYALTQVSKVTKTETVEDCAVVTPLKLAKLPTTDAEKESLEGMLVMPEGDYTVTDNYGIGGYGTISLAQGAKPLYAGTEVAAPGEEAAKVEVENQKREITLDDGSSWDYSGFSKTKASKASKDAHNHPLPYLENGTSLRVGAKAAFVNPVIFDFRNKEFKFQPRTQVVGLKNSPINVQDTRQSRPDNVEGDLKVATFNVLNYFVDLGEDEAKCKGYADRQGNLITTNYCKVRGAYRKADFERQQTKIVAAINLLGADIVSLEEIENSSIFGKNRDVALENLVGALNAAAGKAVWAAVKSPATVPNNGDAIRTAFIYKPATVKTVGESVILHGDAFTRTARSPLAQKFAPVRAGKEFVVVVNHFKSKGSLLGKKKTDNPNADKGDGQGNNNYQRVEQAKVLVSNVSEHFSQSTPVILVGDFNAYSKEDPLQVLHQAGFVEMRDPSGATSYVYKGRSGSLDHVLVNEAAKSLISGGRTHIWQINAQEPVALEYSRFNYNVTNLYQPDPFRASDHNPEIFGLNVFEKAEQPGEGGVDKPGADNPGTNNPGDNQPNQGEGDAHRPTPNVPAPHHPGIVDQTGKHQDSKVLVGENVNNSGKQKSSPDTGRGHHSALSHTGVQAGLIALLALAVVAAGVGLSRTARRK
ncbi:MAG: ExeM/NucH family extracellular endonuclease [Actinomycetaceae bacterium]|nr:ExeM/NucH family extracellular endonuclease [Actinomycetaceae bacterium]